LFLRRIGQRLSLKALILLQPIVCIRNLLRIGRRRTNLRQKRIRIERDWSNQLIELIPTRDSLRYSETRGCQEKEYDQEKPEPAHQTLPL
jgi:hypothetical protein